MSRSEVSDGKIHILYLVKNVPGVSYQMLMDKCLGSLYFDFFNFSKCYNELIAGNLLDREVGDTGTGEVIGNNETIRITRGGEAILEDVESTLNLQTLGYLKKAAADLLTEVAELNSVKAFSVPADDGVSSYVTLSTVKDGRDLSIRLKVPSNRADQVIAAWRSRSSDITDDLIGDLLKTGE